LRALENPLSFFETVGVHFTTISIIIELLCAIRPHLPTPVSWWWSYVTARPSKVGLVRKQRDFDLRLIGTKIRVFCFLNVLLLLIFFFTFVFFFSIQTFRKSCQTVFYLNTRHTINNQNCDLNGYLLLACLDIYLNIQNGNQGGGAGGRIPPHPHGFPNPPLHRSQRTWGGGRVLSDTHPFCRFRPPPLVPLPFTLKPLPGVPRSGMLAAKGWGQEPLGDSGPEGRRKVGEGRVWDGDQSRHTGGCIHGCRSSAAGGGMSRLISCPLILTVMDPHRPPSPVAPTTCATPLPLRSARSYHLNGRLAELN